MDDSACGQGNFVAIEAQKSESQDEADEEGRGGGIMWEFYKLES